eukprot:3387567-Pleurochrysis_carterae.AAC.1
MEIRDWNEKFMDIDDEMVFNLIPAANFLAIKGLLDLSCKKVRDKIRGKRTRLSIFRALRMNA